MEYTEKEKKAITILDEFELRRKTVNYNRITVEDSQCAKTVLNLLEKQNKEINEKDKLLKFNRNYINKLEQDLFENASNYVISKEAIRKKIKEIDENGYWDFLEERDCEKTINILKEILGE